MAGAPNPGLPGPPATRTVFFPVAPLNNHGSPRTQRVRVTSEPAAPSILDVCPPEP